MVADRVVRLEQGLWRDGTCFADATARMLTGEDEAAIADMDPAALPVVRATALIAMGCCIEGVGSLTRNDACLLSLGDRERLLAALYRVNFGERLDAVVQCPATCCGQAVEFEITVASLLTTAISSPERTEGSMPAPLIREIALATDAGGYQVRFRLPNGSDQELAAQVALNDGARAVDLILERCVTEVRDTNGLLLTAPNWLPVLREQLSQTFAEADAQASVTSVLQCPECGGEFMTLIDVGTYLMRKLASRQGIYAEVDQLARAYHWSEPEILALPMARRQRYLALVATERQDHGRVS